MDFWRFTVPDSAYFTEVTASYNPFILFLSLLVSTLAAYSLIVVFKRVWQTRQAETRSQWEWFGSVAFGLGVWAMHFTGMLAFMLPISMSFNVVLTVLSIVPPMCGAYIAARILASQRFSSLDIHVSALALALGIGAMHYIGMEAMRTQAYMVYNPWLFITSIGCAYLLAFIAIFMLVYVQKNNVIGQPGLIACAVVMGMAIAGMHYVAMSAVHYYVATGVDVLHHEDHSGSAILALTITGLVFVIFATTMLGSIVDKRLQAAELVARVSAAREKDIVEHLADGLMIINKNGRISMVNHAGLTMFGYTKQNELRHADINKILPGFNLTWLTEDVESEDKVTQLEGRCADDSMLSCEVNYSPMTAVAENAHLYNVVIRDVSQRLALEDQLRQAQKMESIGQLAAGIAHEINTPTQYVSDNMSFLQGATASCLAVVGKTREFLQAANSEQEALLKNELAILVEDEDIDFFIEEIPVAVEQSSEGLKRIAKIVSAMKSFSHSGDDSMTKVDLKEAINATIIVARSEWRYVADLSAEFAEDLPLITCSRDEVNQVVLNFIVNAAHAVEERYGRDSAAKGHITISVFCRENEVTITIADNGVGMSREISNRIFEPFFTTKPPGKGTGQGLSLAYAIIIEKHHGSITVNSEPGHGTTFNIVLPVEQGNFHSENEESREDLIC